MKIHHGEHPTDLLSAFVDGETTAGERRKVEEHLATCAACVSLLADMRSLTRAVADEAAPPVPAGLQDRIGARFRGSSGRERAGISSAGWRVQLPLAAAAALAGVLVLWVAARGFRGVGTTDEMVPTGPTSSVPGSVDVRERSARPGTSGDAKEPEAPQQKEGRGFAVPDADDAHDQAAEKPGSRPLQAPAKVAAEGQGFMPQGAFAPSPPPGERQSFRDETAASPAPPPPEDKKAEAAGEPDAKPGSRLSGSDITRPSAAVLPESPKQDQRAGASSIRAESAAEIAALPAPRLRWLALTTAEGDSFRLSETGGLSVEGPGYACTVSLQPPAADANQDRGFEQPSRVSAVALGDVTRLFTRVEVYRHAPSSDAGEGASPSGLRLIERDGTILPLGKPGASGDLTGEAASIASTLKQLALAALAEAQERKICGTVPSRLGR